MTTMAAAPRLARLAGVALATVLAGGCSSDPAPERPAPAPPTVLGVVVTEAEATAAAAEVQIRQWDPCRFLDLAALDALGDGGTVNSSVPSAACLTSVRVPDGPISVSAIVVPTAPDREGDDPVVLDSGTVYQDPPVRAGQCTVAVPFEEDVDVRLEVVRPLGPGDDCELALTLAEHVLTLAPADVGWVVSDPPVSPLTTADPCAALAELADTITSLDADARLCTAETTHLGSVLVVHAVLAENQPLGGDPITVDGLPGVTNGDEDSCMTKVKGRTLVASQNTADDSPHVGYLTVLVHDYPAATAPRSACDQSLAIAQRAATAGGLR